MFTSLRIIIRAFSQFATHNCSQMGAALAYYTLFSLAPLLLLAITAAGMIFGETAAEEKVYILLVEYFGLHNADLLRSILESADQLQKYQWVSNISLILALVAALQAFLHIRRSFSVILELPHPGQSSLLGTIVDFSLSILMVSSTALLLLISLGVTRLIALLRTRLDSTLPAEFWTGVDMLCSFFYLILIFAFLFWILSGNAIHFDYVVYGSVICSVLFVLGKIMLALYLTWTTASSIYGPASTLVGFMIWIYYTSQLVFFGAECIQARRTRKEWMK
jgi:membrane protein